LGGVFVLVWSQFEQKVGTILGEDVVAFWSRFAMKKVVGLWMDLGSLREVTRQICSLFI
jgi:hypothetical protein